MTQFQKKPEIIEAKQYSISNITEILDWLNENEVKFVHDDEEEIIIMLTAGGDMRVDPGYWIIKWINGNFYPCKPDIFEATYEPV